jgi:acetyltransferase-like isoleucine patch superfamily enzyme
MEYVKVGTGTIFVDTPYIPSARITPIVFGKYCAIGRGLKILTLNHDYNYPAIQGTFYRKFFGQSHPGEMLCPPTPQRTKGGVTIGSDVWIGEDVVIFSGVNIGHGCCVGARSVVTHDLPPYTICCGVPCKVVKQRYSEPVVELMLHQQWWDWDDEKIRRNKKFFQTNLNLVDAEEIKSRIM